MRDDLISSLMKPTSQHEHEYTISAPPSLPPITMVSYFEMAKAAIVALKERGGSSSQAIKKVGLSVSSRASAGPPGGTRARLSAELRNFTKLNKFETRPARAAQSFPDLLAPPPPPTNPHRITHRRSH